MGGGGGLVVNGADSDGAGAGWLERQVGAPFDRLLDFADGDGVLVERVVAAEFQLS